MENIANLIPTEDAPSTRAPRYQSKHSEKVKKEASTRRAGAGMMGPRKAPGARAADPKQFMKKQQGGGAGARVKKEAVRKGPMVSTKAPVPRASERPVMGMKTKKDFVKTNAVKAMQATPRGFEATAQDGVGGRFKLEESGLVPKYSKKDDFGKVPDYLVGFKEEKAKQQQEYEAYVAEVQRQSALYEVPQAERAEVLSGLKQNWTALKKEYQGLSVVTDTSAKKLRRTRMESQLAQLEQDIQTIERHQIIYVGN